jgi:hypothetical protein
MLTVLTPDLKHAFRCQDGQEERLLQYPLQYILLIQHFPTVDLALRKNRRVHISNASEFPDEEARCC